MTFSHECIVCIVNTGFSDAVMDAAREFGARGGTVIHGRGTGALRTAVHNHCKKLKYIKGVTVSPDYGSTEVEFK